MENQEIIEEIVQDNKEEVNSIDDILDREDSIVLEETTEEVDEED